MTKWWSADWVFVTVLVAFAASLPLSGYHVQLLPEHALPAWEHAVEWKGDVSAGTVVRVACGMVAALQAWKRSEIKERGGDPERTK